MIEASGLNLTLEAELTIRAGGLTRRFWRLLNLQFDDSLDVRNGSNADQTLVPPNVC